MASINEYPKINTPEEVPYLISLKIKLQYAKEYRPEKVAYYEELIRQWESMPFIKLD